MAERLSDSLRAEIERLRAVVLGLQAEMSSNEVRRALDDALADLESIPRLFEFEGAQQAALRIAAARVREIQDLQDSHGPHAEPLLGQLTPHNVRSAIIDRAEKPGPFRIVIKCPQSGAIVSTGVVVRDLAEFNGALLPRRILTCPSCGRQHGWTKAIAWLEPEA